MEVAEGERDSRRSLEGLQTVPEELVLEYPLVRNFQRVPLCPVSHLTLFCSLYLMAKANSIPGVKVKSAWSKQLFSASSTKPDTWLAPFRQAALEVYKQVNEAVAA